MGLCEIKFLPKLLLILQPFPRVAWDKIFQTRNTFVSFTKSLNNCSSIFYRIIELYLAKLQYNIIHIGKNKITR